MNHSYFSLLTPPGKSALATIALSGGSAWECLRALFRPIRSGALPEKPQAGRFWLGRLTGELTEEAVLAVRCEEPILAELHVHGGQEVVRHLYELFVARALVPRTWTQMLTAHEDDAVRRQALVALAKTTTTRTASIVLDQYQGALQAYLRGVEEKIDSGQPRQAREMLERLLAYSELGRRLTTPWRVLIAGAPNAGKSSLVNALAGYQRSVVSPVPGTTRDLVTVRLAVDGWPIELIDTAGIRSVSGSLERMGIEQAQEAMTSVDLVLWLLDSSQPPAWPETQPTPLRYVVNKIDLNAAWDTSTAKEAVRISATTGQGMEDFIGALSGWLVKNPPPPGAAVPFTNRMIERLTETVRLVGDSAIPDWRGWRWLLGDELE